MLVKINDVLYEIPKIYTYSTIEQARLYSMDFSLCRTEVEDSVNISVWKYFYRGNEVKVEFVNQ